MTMQASIRYFRDCYEADNRRGTLWNIFHKNIQHRYFLAGQEELLNKALFSVPIDPEIATPAREAAWLYRAEKELLYCSLFVVGSLPLEDGSKEICAPLLIQPAALEPDELGNELLSIDAENRRVNYPLLEALHDSEDGSTNATSLASQVLDLIGLQALTFAEIAEIIKLLHNTLPSVQLDQLFFYPELQSEKALRKALHQSKNEPAQRLKIVPASAIGLIPKSTETRGVLGELSAMAEGIPLSQPLQILLGSTDHIETQNSVRKTTVRFEWVPALLSTPQQQTLQSAKKFPLSLVIGPPGTGKSFTIAAMATEHIAQGQSVLVASKMNHAVDVVGTIVEEQLGVEGLAVRVGRKEYLRSFKKHLENVLGGIIVESVGTKQGVKELQVEHRKLCQAISRLEKTIERTRRKEVRYGKVLARNTKGVIQLIRATWIRWQSKRSTPLWHLTASLEEHLNKRIRLTRALLSALQKHQTAVVLKRHRAKLSALLATLRARRGGRREEMFNQLDFESLFKVFPLWLTNLSDVHRTLPLQTHLFDLAIIDEASLCDVASCLPIFQRAKHVVVTGDPKQLRHLSFLSRSQQQALLQKHGLQDLPTQGLDYRETSILDLVSLKLSSQDNVAFLDEHFRSLPPIIEFSNKEFYHRKLRLMTQHPQVSNELQSSLTLHFCNGKLDQSGKNIEEAQQILADIRSLVHAESELPDSHCSSIGVLAFFRVQADYIAEMIHQEIPFAAMQRHSIAVGTSYSFQGEERDRMFISLTVDPTAHHVRFRFLNRSDTFNVGITRAKFEQRVYCSVRPEQLPKTTLLRQYIEHIIQLTHSSTLQQNDCTQLRGKNILPTNAHSFVQDISRALEAHGCIITPAWEIAGTKIDLIVTKGQVSCGLDLIGYPDETCQPLPPERYQTLMRTGLHILPLPYSQWVVDTPACIETILHTLSNTTTT